MNPTDLGCAGVVPVDHLSDIRDYRSDSKPASHDKGTFVAADALADPVGPRKKCQEGNRALCDHANVPK